MTQVIERPVEYEPADSPTEYFAEATKRDEPSKWRILVDWLFFSRPPQPGLPRSFDRAR